MKEGGGNSWVILLFLLNGQNLELIYDAGGDAESQMLWLTFASRRSLVQNHHNSYTLEEYEIKGH